MSTDATHAFLASAGSHAVDPGLLESLGKQAAVYAENSGLSLHDAVIHQLASESFNGEQVRRVVEIANTEAWNRKFASLDPACRIVDIEAGPADPVAVIHALSSKTAARNPVLPSLEYLMPPTTSTKTASADFVYAVERTAAGARGDILGLHHKLASAHEEAVQSREAAKHYMNQAFEKLAQSTVAARDQGTTAREVYEAWVNVEPEFAKLAFQRVRSVFPDLHAKVAGRRIKTSAQIVEDFREFVRQGQEFVKHAQQVQQLELEIPRVKDWLRHNPEAR